MSEKPTDSVISARQADASADFIKRQLERGECIGLNPNTMVPTNAQGVNAAKRVCENCVIVEPCLEYALVHDIKRGVYGGTSERGRRKLAKQREQAAQLDG